SGFNTNHEAQVYINPALQIVGSMDYYIRAGIVDGTTGGVSARLGITTNTNITSNATAVTGAPIWGNTMTVVQVAIGSITLAEDGSITDSTPDVGDTRVLTNTFKLSNGSVEPMTVERITVLEVGSASVADTTNVELYDVSHAVSLGTTQWTADGKASWPVNLNMDKGQVIRFAVYVDIIDGAALTVETDVSDGDDALIIAKGQTYGFYITPTYVSGTWDGTGDAVQTINSGALVFSKSASTPPTGNIAVGSNQLIAVWDATVTGETMRMSEFTVRGNLAENSGSALTFADMTGATLVDMATGSILAGPVDGTDGEGTLGTTAVDPDFNFTETFDLLTGVTKLGFKVNLGTDWAADDTILVQLHQAADFTAKGVQSGSTVTPTGFTAISNTMTVKAGALVARTLGTPATSSVIVGTQGFTWGTFSWDATASGEDVLITSIVILDTLDATTADAANLDNFEIYADIDGSGTYEASEKIYGPAFPTGGGGSTDTITATLSQTLRVPKGTSMDWIAVADLAAGAVALGTHTLTVAAAAETSSGADTGSDIVSTASGSGGTLTVAAEGSVTSALSASTPVAGLVIAGSTYSTLGAFDFIASNEAYTVDTLTFDLTAGYDSISKLKISYPTKTGTDSRELSVSAAAVSFSGLTMYVPKNDRATVTVTATKKRVGTVGTGGNFHDIITLVLDTSAAGEFNAVGESSGVAQVGTDVSDQTANNQYLHNTMPTVVSSNPGTPGTIVPGGTVDLYKFKVTADAAGAVAIKSFHYSVFITDASTTTASSADLTNFTILRNGVDITASAQITEVSEDGAAFIATPLTLEATNYLENNTSYWVQVAFGTTPALDTEEVIAANATVEYTLRAQAGTGFTTTDAISTSLLQDTTDATATAVYLADADTGTGVQQVVALQTAAGISFWTATGVHFIWSDRSTVIHVASFDDDGVTETSSADWTNGYLVPNYPLSSYGLTL
ncbi:hypothetical protein KKE14_00735, partial [Patescibacteria group bacterium]|nr:hypothetical protein [Patescibacteria group bacterium]